MVDATKAKAKAEAEATAQLQATHPSVAQRVQCSAATQQLAIQQKAKNYEPG